MSTNIFCKLATLIPSKGGCLCAALETIPAQCIILELKNKVLCLLYVSPGGICFT